MSRLLRVASLLLLLPSAMTAAGPPLSSDGNRTSNSTEVFNQIEDYTGFTPSRLPLSLGGQDFRHRCCASALLASINDTNGLSLYNTSGSISLIGSLEDYSSVNPCGDTFSQNPAGSPVIQVSYKECSDKCPGWQISKNSPINQWVGPFVGFVVPAVIFSFSISRQRRLYIPDRLFMVGLNETLSLFRVPFMAILAGIIVLADSVLWVGAIFALSGPILVSGVHEARLDARMISYLQENIRCRRLTLAQRAHVLYVILVGNLEISGHSDVEADETPWNHIDGSQGLLRDLRDQKPSFQAVGEVKTRLRTILLAQSSFGLTVGVPVIFFCGSFLYTLIDNLSNLGDNNVSHALAFGMWWMTIPHIAIVSSLLLASNDPHTFEGVVSRPTVDSRKSHECGLALVYESRYRPAWIWERGRSKRIWAKRLEMCGSDAPEALGEVLEFGKGEWLNIALIANALIHIPSVFAFLTSYYTPAIGLSCRSMTFLAYMLCQLLLTLLWVWDIKTTFVDSKGEIHQPCHYTRLRYIWWPSTILLTVTSGFLAIGGTMMQIMGVYRNCLCSVPIIYWRNPNSYFFTISTNSIEEIYFARHYWTSIGATATAFLGIVTFVGWWYQKRLRCQITSIINFIDREAEDETSDRFADA